ncbi:hypothetical protein J40TS1_33350 [Paenibacillus montaniterrae]|uniref:Uncharacterized protein n=2 Tax=Paenibacillus montaniterrae TaxID=429341 RepID=A0A920CZP3_9BACL|nr:hypothetical protein J40TS1_33350 [Paenibacillus montaniterrae]
MSVSLALVPIALAMRLVMGKKNFDNWVQSMQFSIPSLFEKESELARTVRKAGYDCEKWGSSYKTHIDGEDLFFFWEFLNGKWVAVFGKYDSRQHIERFIANVNRAAGKQMFDVSTLQQNELKTGSAALPATNTTAAMLPQAFPTNFRDGELLFKTLKEFGINPVRNGSVITCKIENSHLTFRQSGDHPFQVEIHNEPDLRKIFQYLSDIDDDYKRCLQEVVYKKLKARAEERNMTIESEEVMEDNSIVLTLNIGS